MLIRIAPWLFVTTWATGYIGMKFGSPYAEPMTFLSIRFLAVLAVLVPTFYVMGVALLPWRDAMRAAVIGAWLHGIYLGAILWAIKHGMATGVAALVISLQPIITALLGALFLGDKIKWRHWMGLFLGVGGVGLVIFPGLDFAAPVASFETLLACLFSLAAITFATLIQKAFGSDLDLLASLIPQYVGAASVVSLFALAFETREVQWTSEFVLAQVWLVLVLSIGAVSLLLLLLRENAVWRTSALFYLIPPITAVFGWLMFGETLEVIQLVGMSIAVFAVILARQKSPKDG